MHDHHVDSGNQTQHGAEPQQDRYDEQFWEDRYRSQPAIWSGRPNPVLVTDTADLTAGSALDVGCGEGGDALWLAQQGWLVTAVDFATAALDRGAARAKELGIDDRIRWVHADLINWRPAQSYDLISCQYLHLLGTQQEELLPRLADAVAPGGTLLYVSHSFEGQVAAERPHLIDRFLSTDRITELLDPATWRICTAGIRQRADAGEHPAGHVHDSVLLARRLG